MDARFSGLHFGGWALGGHDDRSVKIANLFLSVAFPVHTVAGNCLTFPLLHIFCLLRRVALQRGAHVHLRYALLSLNR